MAENPILERISDGLVTLDREWRYTYVNAKAGELVRRDPGQLIGRRIWTEFPHNVGRRLQQACERAMASQEVVRFEAYSPTYERWFEYRIFPSPDGLTIYFSDVTERRQAEEAIRRERDFSNALLDGLPGVFYLYDRGFSFRRWNRTFETVTGYAGDEIARMSPLDFFAGPDQELLASRIDEVFARGSSSVEADFVAKDGTRTPYFFTGARVELDGEACLLGVGIDVSRRREAEQGFRDSERRLRLALEAAGLGIFDWDVPGDHITWSRRHEELWGFEPGGFAGTYAAFAARVHPDDLPRVNVEVERCIRERAPFAAEFRVVRPDGETRWIAGRGEFTFGPDGRVERMHGVVMDATERRRADERLREHAAALRSLTERLQVVREEEGRRIARELHDELGQSLTGLRIDLSWIDRRLAAAGGTEAIAELRGRVAAMTEQLDETVRTVRRISSELRPMVLDDLGLPAAIEWQLHEYQKRTGIRCEAHLPPEETAIPPDRATAVFRILTESLTNVVRHAAATRVEVALAIDEHEVRLDVADNGRGMPGGTAGGRRSLGILGMEERARALGGTVGFEARPGGGTRVVLRLPLP